LKRTTLRAARKETEVKIHFIGIGGIGLSALAKFLSNEGHEISGSDIKQTEITNDLATNFHAKITIPHHPDAVVGVDVVIYSAAVRPTNVEYKHAKKLGMELLSRKEALSFILKEKEVYAVGGAHGKSTTSAMLASILPQSNALIGAISKEFGSNVRHFDNDRVVFEADESDESFLNCNPTLAIVTNVEPEHMEYYGYDETRFYDAYRNFVSLAKIRVINAEDDFLASLEMESHIHALHSWSMVLLKCLGLGTISHWMLHWRYWLLWRWMKRLKQSEKTSCTTRGSKSVLILSKTESSVWSSMIMGTIPQRSRRRWRH